jgi:hypothetical protein
LEEDKEDEGSSEEESEEPKEHSEDDAVAPAAADLENAFQSLKVKGDENADQDTSDGRRIFRASSGSIGVQDDGEDSGVGDMLTVGGTTYGKAGVIPKVVGKDI